MTTRTDTQLAIIRRHLLSGKSITPMEALNLCGCFRLSAVIHRLRHNEGYPILMVQPEVENGKPYAKYWIDKDYFIKQTEIPFEKEAAV